MIIFRDDCYVKSKINEFAGFAGGGSYDQSGSASEYVCLSPNPIFIKTSGYDYGRM
jgi:hypothetical protein